MPIIDDRTDERNYPKPNPANDLADDVLRLAEALDGIDMDIAAVIIALAGKSATGHGHAMSDVSGLTDALAGKSGTGHTHALDDLSDVTTGGAANGQFLKRAAGAWQPAVPIIGDVTGLQTALNGKAALKGESVVIPRGDTATRPTAVAGESLLRYNTETVSFEGWNGATWGKVGGGAAINSAPPTPATPGDLWFSSELGVLFVYYNDGDSSQWVSASAGLDPSLLLLKANNFSDLASVDTGLTNLGFGAFGKTLRALADAAAGRAALGQAWVKIFDETVAGAAKSAFDVNLLGYANLRFRLDWLYNAAVGDCGFGIRNSVDGGTTYRAGGADYYSNIAYTDSGSFPAGGFNSGVGALTNTFDNATSAIIISVSGEINAGAAARRFVAKSHFSGVGAAADRLGIGHSRSLANGLSTHLRFMSDTGINCFDLGTRLIVEAAP